MTSSKLTQDIIDNAPEGAQRYNATGKVFHPYLKMSGTRGSTFYFYNNHEGEWIEYVTKVEAEKHWQDAIELYPADNTAQTLKLKAGHYVLTKDIEDDEQYREICEKFIEAGADIGEYGVEGENRNSRKSVGWCAEVGLFHSDICGFYIDGSEKMADPSYQLTPEQVLSANSENKEGSVMQEELKPEKPKDQFVKMMATDGVNRVLLLSHFIQQINRLKIKFRIDENQANLSVSGATISCKPSELSDDTVQKFFALVESIRSDKD